MITDHLVRQPWVAGFLLHYFADHGCINASAEFRLRNIVHADTAKLFGVRIGNILIS